MHRASPSGEGNSEDALSPQRPLRPQSVLADIDNGISSGVGGGSSRGSPDVAKAAAAVVLGGAIAFGAAAAAPPSLFGARPAVASTSSAALSSHSTADFVAYKIQKVFGLPLFGKICCLFLFTVPMVAVGGMLYKVVGPDDDGEEGESWMDALAQSFYLLNNVPGADATGDSSVKRAAVTQSIVFVGMFVFAVIIGIISDEIASKVDEVKTGNSMVVETDHTVVVNWNSQLVPLLKQMAVAKAERAGTFDKPVVLLADMDKATMDEELAEALQGCPPLEVVTRRGSPFDAEDLAKVNAAFARRVIILHPNVESSNLPRDRGGGDADEEGMKQRDYLRQQREEAHKATVVLNLRQEAAAGGRRPDLVVQMPNRIPENQDLVRHALKITRRQEVLDGLVGADDVYAMPYVQVHGGASIVAFLSWFPSWLLRCLPTQLSPGRVSSPSAMILVDAFNNRRL